MKSNNDSFKTPPKKQSGSANNTYRKTNLNKSTIISSTITHNENNKSGPKEFNHTIRSNTPSINQHLKSSDNKMDIGDKFSPRRGVLTT